MVLDETHFFWGLCLEAFNNYVDQILPNFGSYHPQVDKNGHFTYHLPIVT